MAGRGREATLPAWMKEEQHAQIAQNFVAPAVGQFDNAPMPPQERSREMPPTATVVAPIKMEDTTTSAARGERSHRRSPSDHRRHRSERPERSERSERSSRRSRSRDRPSSRPSRGHDRSVERRPRMDRAGRYETSRSNHYASSSSVARPPRIPRRQRKPSHFDVYPSGVTDDNAAAFATQAILQHNMAALQGAIGPASFGGAPPPAAMMGMRHTGGDGTFNEDNPQLTRHARRIYVGGIDDCHENDLKFFFNDVIDKAMGKPTPGGSVLSVYINRERHFSFVELSSIELANACMNLDGISFNGNPVKIRRPNDYNPNALPSKVGDISDEFNLSALGIVSTTVPDGPNKIFVGGIPYHLSDAQVKELLSAFGDLRAFHLVRDVGSDISKGYGFCEYMDPAVTDQACEGLDDLSLGDKKLTVRKATPGGPPGAQPSAFDRNPHTATAGPAYQTTSMAGVPLDPPRSQPTRILVLANMVTEEELADEEEYTDIVQDIKGECEKYGPIGSLVIPRPGDGLGAVGKVFVEFTALSDCQKAAVELHGRGFASRTVLVDFLAEDAYRAKQFNE